MPLARMHLASATGLVLLVVVVADLGEPPPHPASTTTASIARVSKPALCERKMRVLVIEDDEELAETIAVGLREASMAVDIALDGNAGLARALVNDYVDRDLPGLHGDQVWREAGSRRRPRPGADAHRRGAGHGSVEGPGLGADDYLPKPFAFAVSTLASQAMSARQSSLAELDIDLRTSLEPACISGDPWLIEQLITNLIDNAIGHNTPGGQLKITTGTQDRHPPTWRSATPARRFRPRRSNVSSNRSSDWTGPVPSTTADTDWGSRSSRRSPQRTMHNSPDGHGHRADSGSRSLSPRWPEPSD
jgi:CheY-like chemotaxis protein